MKVLIAGSTGRVGSVLVELMRVRGYGRNAPVQIPDVIARFYPQTELRYDKLQAHLPFVRIARALRLLGFAPGHTWRSEDSRS